MRCKRKLMDKAKQMMDTVMLTGQTNGREMGSHSKDTLNLVQYLMVQATRVRELILCTTWKS